MSIGVEKAQKFGAIEGLPLYYVHADNPNNGDGSVNNPYKNFELLNAFFDANPTVVGATVIVLGGTFVTTSNIYRGSSFYFFPGTKISFFPANPTDCLFQDNGSYTGYDTDFFLKGDVEIEMYGGAFLDLGYYYSNVAQNAGKKWSVDIASLKVSTGDNLNINKLYGSINTYDIKIKAITCAAVDSNFFLIQKDERNLVNIVTIANSGCSLSFNASTVSISGANVNFINSGTGDYDFLGRFPYVSIGQLVLGNYGFRFWRGKINRSRKMVFTSNINNVLLNSQALGGNNYMIENDQPNYQINESAYFIFENTKFTYNTALGLTTPLKLCARNNAAFLYPIFKNCTRVDDFSTETTDDALAQGCYDIGGFVLSIFGDNNNSLCNSIINN